MPPTRAVAVRKSVAAVTVKSRTWRASKVWERPSVLTATWSPLVARTSLRSLSMRTRTSGLTGVTNGSPWLGRVNGVARLIHGSQRYMSMIPLALVNSQSEPLVPVRSVAT